MAVRLYAVVLALLTCGACVPEQPQASRQPVVAVQQRTLVTGSEPILLDRIVLGIRTGTKIGTSRECVFCDYTDVYWSAGIQLRSADFVGRFIDALSAAGYRVVGDPARTFDRANEQAAARYLVAGHVADVEVLSKISGGPERHTDVRVKVNWQVYSQGERRVAYEVATEGNSTLSNRGVDMPLAELVNKAFSEAVTGLAADAGFQRSVAISETTPQPSVAAAVAAAFELPAYSRHTGPVSGRAREITNAAVTILIPGGHGSGFFVSEDGMILTNQHVVGHADQVSVRLAAGIELPGRVLRHNTVRDVALVKVDIARIRPLPLSSAAPAVGNEVYALGSPSDPNLAGTLTRGIVSAVRVIDQAGIQLPMIQSDATIYSGNSGGPLLDASGNVIGIAVSSAAHRGQAVAGVNFFIPIDDALRYLNIRLGQPRELRF